MVACVGIADSASIGSSAALIGTLKERSSGWALVRTAVEGASESGCEWLHVDWDRDLDRFSLGACGFTPSRGMLSPSTMDAIDNTLRHVLALH